MFARFRKTSKSASVDKNLPWDNPSAQPPPLPTSYTSYSPLSLRKPTKPANFCGPTIEPPPQPMHFNRQSPATSPAISRRPDKQSGECDKGNREINDLADKPPVIEAVPWRSPPSRRKVDKQNTDQAANLITSEENEQRTETTQIHNSTMMSGQNNPQKGVEKQSCANLNGVKMAPPANENVSLQFVKQNGLQSNYESISTVMYSFDQSYSEASEKSFMSNQFSSEMVSAQQTGDGGVKPREGSAPPPNPPQQPPPTSWRNANVSETSAKVDASADKAPWRKEKETPVSTNLQSKEVPVSTNLQSKEVPVSTNLQSKEVPLSNPTITSTPRRFVETQQKRPQQAPKPPQYKIQQIPIRQQQQCTHFGASKVEESAVQIQQRQPQHQTKQQDVPWRSPHLKKKDLSNTQSPAFHHINQLATSTKQHSAAEQISQQSTRQNVHSSSEKVLESLSKQETFAGTKKEEEKVILTQSEKFVTQTLQKKEDKLETEHKQIPPSSPPLAPSRETPNTARADDSKANEDKVNEETVIVSTEAEEKSVEIIKTKSHSEVTEIKEQSKTSLSSTTCSSCSSTSSSSSSSEVDSFSPPPPPMIPQHEETETFAPNPEDATLPSPPSVIFKMEELPSDVPCQPPSGTVAFRIAGHDSKAEEDLTSPEYERVPVTSRIKRFEKQASVEADKKKEEYYPQIKPVAPWVKKTSAGPVHREEWDLSPIQDTSPHPEESCLQEVKEPPKREMEKSAQPASNVSQTSDKESKLCARQDTVMLKPVVDVLVSDVKVALSKPSKEKEMTSLKHKQLQLLQSSERLRTRSTGDYSHSYTENDVLKMPASADGTGVLVPTMDKPETSLKPVDPVFDPFCDPDNPKLIQFQDISAAAFKIKSGILNTPCTRSVISRLVDMEVFFKKEFNQYTGSFKERGARYTLLCLSDEQKAKGVIAASAGNHALALCYHGQDLGIPVTVVMPLVAPIMKVQACRQYGANIMVKGADIGECREIALRMSTELGLTYVNGYDHPHILAGQGTMGLEIVEQVKGIDAVVVPVGGGGLIAGIALAVKSLYPNIKIIGVESERCASFTAAMKAKKPVYVKAEPTLADGLAMPKVGVNAFALASKLIDKMVTVKEEWIAIAILRLVEMEKAVVEGAGAAALAALLAGELPELKGKRVVIPLCGGNIDTTILGRCLERGLAADGRLIKFTVTVSDRPGGIADLTRLLANLGVSIKDMLHERAWIKSDIFSVACKVVCETRDREHTEELKQALSQRYPALRFGSYPATCVSSR